VWAQAADDPTPADLDKGIETPHCAADNSLIEDLWWSVVVFVRPATGGRNQSLSFASDFASLPVRDGDKSRVSQTAQAGDSINELIRQVMHRHEVFDGVDCAYRHSSLYRREGVHLRPEAHRVTQLAFGDSTKPCMVLAQNERPPAFSNSLLIAVENRIT